MQPPATGTQLRRAGTQLRRAGTQLCVMSFFGDTQLHRRADTVRVLSCAARVPYRYLQLRVTNFFYRLSLNDVRMQPAAARCAARVRSCASRVCSATGL